MKNLLEPDNYDLKKEFDYPPMKKSIETYKERVNARWAKVSFRIKSAFKFISLILVVGIIAPHVQAYV